MAGLSKSTIEKFYKQFEADKKNSIALNTCVKYGPQEILHSRRYHELTSHLFNHKVCSETGLLVISLLFFFF